MNQDQLNRNMRVLVFMVDSNWGGPHNIIYHVAPSLRGHGYDVIVAFSQEQGNAEARYVDVDVKVHRIPLHRFRRYSGRIRSILKNIRNVFGMVGDIGRLRTLIRTENIDIVQVSGVMAIQGGVAAWLERKPVVWQLLGLVTPRTVMALYMPFIVSVSAVVMSVGKAVAARHFFVSTRARRLIYFVPPVDTNSFFPDPGIRGEVRESLNFRPDDYIVGVVGNRNPAKGHEYFVRIAAKCRDLGLPFKFLVVGKGTLGSADYYEKNVIGLARQLELLEAGTLRFIEPELRIESYMRCFDAFVLPSRTEGMPTVLLEAMATGLPTISHNVGSVSEVITEDVGRIVEIGEVDRICDFLEQFWADPALAASLGAKARLLAERDFGVERCAELHLLAYADALAGQGAVRWRVRG